VMMMAMTPSLKASSRPLVMAAHSIYPGDFVPPDPLSPSLAGPVVTRRDQSLPVVTFAATP